jgi:hypothetical protein
MQVQDDVLGILCPVNGQGKRNVMHFIIEPFPVPSARDQQFLVVNESRGPD